MEGECAERNFVGDWLVGMCTRVGEEFARGRDGRLQEDGHGLRRGGLSRARLHGPGVRRRQSSGGSAASSVCRPTSQGNPHVFSRTLFMIQYGVRTMRPRVIGRTGVFPRLT